MLVAALNRTIGGQGPARLPTIDDVAQLYAEEAEHGAPAGARRGGRVAEPVIEDACQVAWSRLLIHRRGRGAPRRAWLVRVAGPRRAAAEALTAAASADAHAELSLERAASERRRRVDRPPSRPARAVA